MNYKQKGFLLTLLRLVRDKKIRYNKLYFKHTINLLEMEEIIKEIEGGEE